MISISHDKTPIEVDSAFGGLGIYKKSAILSSSYIGLDDNEEEFCEHVYLHTIMRRKGLNLYIVPSLINSGWNEHSKDLQFTSRIRDNLRYSIKKLFTNTRS
jgi:hypothetical protein